jgi:hypothetical protein
MLDNDFLTVKFDYKEFNKLMEKFKDKAPKIIKRLMAGVFKLLRKDARKKARASFTSRTGRLVRSIQYWAFNDWSGAITTKQNAKTNSGWYSRMVEEGHTSQVKDEEKYLTFKVNGEWKKVKRVSAAPRPFMKPPFNEYWVKNDGSKAKAIINGLLQKELDKLDKENKENK